MSEEAQMLPSAETADATRTTGSESPSCRHCGGPIRGRRRNGYCSDRCRMRDRRATRPEKLMELLMSVEAAVAELRAALLR